MLERETERVTNEFNNAVLGKAVENMTVAVPESMIAEQTDEFLRNYADSMGARNVSRADLVKSLGLSEEAFATMMRPGAERQVKTELLLDAVARAEGIEATDEDKEEFYKRLADDYGDQAESIKSMIDEKLMARDITRRKAADVIYNSAVKTEPKPEEETPAEETPAEETAPAEENQD